MQLQFIERPKLDAVALGQLRRAVGWDERLKKIRLTLGRCYYWAGCFDGGKLIGFVEVVSDGVDDAYIRNLMVHPDYQRRGIGLKLLQMAQGRIKADGIKTVNLLFEPELAPFYRKAGFRIVSGGLIDNEAGTAPGGQSSP